MGTLSKSRDTVGHAAQPFLNPGIIGRRAPLQECRQERLGRGPSQAGLFFGEAVAERESHGEVVHVVVWFGSRFDGKQTAGWCWARRDAKA